MGTEICKGCQKQKKNEVADSADDNTSIGRIDESNNKIIRSKVRPLGFGLSNDNERISHYEGKDCNKEFESADARHYVSMSTSSILMDSSIPIIDMKANESSDKVSNVLMVRRYLIFYFEFHYMILANSQALKVIYPDGNFFFSVSLNDNPNTIEKIFLYNPKTQNEAHRKFIPLLKQDDNKANCYRVLKFIEATGPQAHDGLKPNKLVIKIHLYINKKHIQISEDSFFFFSSSNVEREMSKYLFYTGVSPLIGSVKFANIHFCVGLQHDTINSLDHSEYIRILNTFTKTEKLMTYHEDSLAWFKYLNIPNSLIRAKRKLSESVRSIIDIDCELTDQNLNIERLLELTSEDNDLYKYEIFDILKRLYVLLDQKELNQEMEKLHMLTLRIFQILDDIKDSQVIWDKVFVPLLFALSEKILFKTSAKCKLPSNSQKFIDSHTEIILGLFALSCDFALKARDCDITLSSLKFILSCIKPIILSKDYLVNYLISSKKHFDICDVLLCWWSNESCALLITTVILKLLKYKNMKLCNDIADIFKQRHFLHVVKDILDTHDCNSIILSNVLTMLIYFSDILAIESLIRVISFAKLREIFLTFRYSIDELHEKIIRIIKILLEQNEGLLTEDPDCTLINEADYRETASIFSSAMQYLKAEIESSPELKISPKGTCFMLSLVNGICSSINNVPRSQLIQMCIEKKLQEHMVDFLHLFYEKGGFRGIFCTDNVETASLQDLTIKLLFQYSLLLQSIFIFKPTAIVSYAFF